MKASSSGEEHEQLARTALVHLFGLQLRAGLPAAALQALACECALEAKRLFQTSARSETKRFDAQDYGSVLKTWHRDANYLSSDGFPRPLLLTGKYGLRLLIERYYPSEHYQRVLIALRKAGLIRELRDKKWLPTKRCAVFPKLNDELLAHVAEGVSKLVQTVNRNVTSPRKDALFERSTKVRNLPIDAGPAFRAFVNSQAMAFLSTVDDWLEANAMPTKARGRKSCAAGVFSFAFLDDAGLIRPHNVPVKKKSPSRR
jgi:hypothetical protein